ncbi:MAG: DegT/DnrJ/EryC1/StrS family aminotransferase [Deltaproteobacteria bacterium]|nr:DegT/DnrJ/EryC1/StrS family aminotransferase [Deltaproteobacteria bacterium]
MSMIPVNEPLLDGNEVKYLEECIRTGWISSEGPFVKKFEEMFASFVGVKHGVAVCNGTAALEAALYGAGVGEGDEVIMPSFTIISCAIAAIRLGAKPVLVDIEPDTWCMDVMQTEAKITAKTKAIMPVHIYGHPVDMDPLTGLAKKHGLVIIEDAAEVHGAEYKGKRCGSIGDVAAFSFYANKIVTTGEGGMVVTNDASIAEKARSYRNLCFRPEKRFYHTELGYNFRMTNLQAAVGVAQTERIEEFIAIKRRLGAYYRERLAAIPGVRFQVEKPWAKSVYWMYAVELDESTRLLAEDVMGKLKKENIGTRPFFMGLHEQPVFHGMGLFEGERYPVTERAYRQGFYLPSGLTLTDEKVDIVCDRLMRACGKEVK